jgi:hypothetical protein
MTTEPPEVCDNCGRPSAECTAADSANCQLAASLAELQNCDDCVRCELHREPVEIDDGGEETAHDPAECGCNVGRPCSGCKLTAERDLALADLDVALAAIKSMIGRNGFCVVCEKYAPWHLMTCIMVGR